MAGNGPGGMTGWKKRVFTGPDRRVYHVSYEWKRKVGLMLLNRRSRVYIFDKSEIVPPDWSEHLLKSDLRRGDILYQHGRPCEVVGFYTSKGKTLVGIASEFPRAHQKLYLAASIYQLKREGFRLPFPGESSAQHPILAKLHLEPV